MTPAELAARPICHEPLLVQTNFAQITLHTHAVNAVI